MLTYFVAYSIEQNQFSVGHEIPPHFMEPEYSILYSQVPTTCPYTEPAWSSPNPPHPTSWRPILILSYHLFLGLPSGLFASDFFTKSLYMHLLSPICATCFIQLILLDVITRTILGEQYRSFSSSLCHFLHSLVTSSLSGPNTLLNTLFSNTLRLCSSLNVSYQVSHPYNNKGRIIVLYILIFKFLDSILEDKRFYTEW